MASRSRALERLRTPNTFNLTTSADGQPVGISIETNVSNSSVTSNQILAVVTTSTGGYGGRGITVGTGTTSSNITVANNFVAGVNGSNYSSFSSSSSMGIGLGVLGNGSLTTTTGGVKLYHNSVNMYGNYSYATACLTAGLYVGTGASALDIRNNIIVNSLNNTNAGDRVEELLRVLGRGDHSLHADQLQRLLRGRLAGGARLPRRRPDDIDRVQHGVHGQPGHAGLQRGARVRPAHQSAHPGRHHDAARVGRRSG